MKATLIFAFLGSSLLAAANGLAQSSTANPESLALAQTAVTELQSRVSAYDMSLVEPLSALADQQIGFGELELAHRTLDRAMQIVRINQGLFTRAQHPLLHKKIDNLIDQGHWEDARAQLAHLVYLYSREQQIVSQELLDGITKLSDAHLRGISQDSSEYQGFHFSRVSASNRIALSIGEALWGEHDPRMVPLIYRVLSQFSLEYAAISFDGRTGIELRTVVPGSNWIREVSEMRQYYLLVGTDLIARLKAVYSSDAAFDAEAMAMTDLYLADWLNLFNQNEAALAAYSQAYENLLAANVDTQLIEQFFATPRILPEPQFFTSLSHALEGQAAGISPALSSLEPESSTQVQLFFSEWSEAFPYVQQPVNLAEAEINSNEFAIFTFNIGGFPDIERLLQGRRPVGLGVVENLTALTELPDSSYQKRRLLKRVGSLRFRPKLVRGIPHEIDATLIYALAANY